MTDYKTEKEKEAYTRLSNAIINAIKPGDPKDVIASVLLKHLLERLIIYYNYNPEAVLIALSGAINECVIDMKEKKLI